MPDTTHASSVSQVKQKTPVFQKVLVVLSLMVAIGGSLTGIMTYANTGFTATFLSDWFTAFAFTALIMIPAGILLTLVLGRFINAVIPGATKTAHNIIVGVLMALSMESVMAASTTANNIGFSNLSIFFDAWFTSYIVTLPFGLIIGITMSLTIKPKLEKFMAS
ncbi:MAG: DUF2798 domain-containing protein [Bermanella sp.]